MGSVVMPRLNVSGKDARRLAIIDAMPDEMDDYSVESICRAAGVSRKVFYSCFSSKHDMANWWSSYCERFYLDEMGRTLGVYDAYVYHFTLMNEHDPCFRSYTRIYGVSSFGEGSIVRRRCETLLTTLRDYRHVPIDERMSFCVRTFASLEVQLASTLGLDQSIAPEQEAQNCVDMMPSMLVDALRI